MHSPHEKKKSGSQFEILGFDVSHLEPHHQFLVCVAGIFLCYGLYGVLQEKMFLIEGFNFAVYLTLVQFIVYVVVCRIEIAQSGHDIQPKAPIRSYAVIGAISVGTVGLSNVACAYLIYPMQVLLKSCKLLPVMLVGSLYFKKSYHRLEHIAIGLFCLGILFSSAGSTLNAENLSSSVFADPKFTFGFTVMCGALLADAVIGNAQEHVMVTYETSSSEMILYSKLCGVGYLLIWAVISGEFWAAFVFCLEHPVIYLYMFVFSFLGCLGEHFVMMLIKIWGPLIAVIVTSSRKLVTVALSFLLFPKNLSASFFFGMTLIFAGMFMEMYSKNKKAVDAQFSRFCYKEKEEDDSITSMV